MVYGVMGVENDILPGEPLKELFCVLLNDNKNAAVQIRRRISFGMCETKSFADEVLPDSFPLLIMRDFPIGKDEVSLREIRKQCDSIMGL